MLSGRMLRIVDYLNHHKKSSYKEISIDLEIKERYVRYDIDKINDYFSFHNYSIIDKQPKGVVVFPTDIDISLLVNKDSFIYSVKERNSLIYYILLFDYKRVNIEHFSRDFQVSRTTIKNDLTYIQEFLSDYQIVLFYDKHFDIKNYNRNIIDLMTNELSQYIYLFKNTYMQKNSFENYAFEMVNRSFPGVSINQIICYIDRLFDKKDVHLTEESYCWFVSNVLLLIWFLTHQEELPEDIGFDAPHNLDNYYEEISELEDIVKVKITRYYRGTLIQLFDYINSDEGLYKRIDILHVQTIITQLIEKMSKELNVDFSSDRIFLESLYNHIVPLIKRLSASRFMSHNLMTVIPEQDMYVYEAVRKVIKQIDVLYKLESEDEITFIAVHFIASMKRFKKVILKHVLIVCSHGYGSSTMLRESLLNEFEVKVIDVIPSYKLSTYPYFDSVDCIVSTIPLKESFQKQMVTVEPLLTEIDYKKLISMGFQRKEIKINYYSLNNRLDFLETEDRQKVLKILQSELGYQDYRIPKSQYKVTDLLKPNCICLVDEDMLWKETILRSSRLLEDNQNVSKGYGEKIVQDILNTGFYCVTDQCFALFHGKEQEDVYYSGMSMIVNHKTMHFDEKNVNVVLCLASKDKKDQIPAMILLMRMVKKTNLLEQLKKAVSSEDIFHIILECESQIIS